MENTAESGAGISINPSGSTIITECLIVDNMADNYGGGPVGVETLAAALSEQRDTIDEVIEPYLIQQGFLMRTPRGRMLADKAYRHLGLARPPGSPQLDLIAQAEADDE